MACSAEGDKPGEVVACFTIQPELRYAEEAEEPLFTFAVLSDTHVTRRLISHNNANYWQALRQITTEAPAEIPIYKALNSIIIGKLAPTAAIASDPTKLPTTRESTTL